MLYSDTALEQLRTCLSSHGYPFESNQLDEKTVRLNVKVSNYIIPVWFLVDKQIYGFDMLNGGSKTCSTIEEFSKYFSTYIYINVDFVPKAKLVADVFEKEINVNSVYDSFSGNKEEGYTAKFRVLSSAGQFILINKDNTLYVARLVTYSEDGSKFRVITEYKYDLDDVGNVTNVPTIYSYLAKLTDLYEASEVVNIDRVGLDTFIFTIDELNITADVVFSYTDISYRVRDINGVAFDEVVELNDPYELQDLYLKCHDSYEAKLIDEDDSEPEQEVEDEQEIETDTQVEVDIQTNLSEQEESSSAEDTEIESSDVDGDTDIEQADEADDEESLEESDESSTESEDDGSNEGDSLEEDTEDNSDVEPSKDPEEDKVLESNDFSVKKVIKDGNDLGLQFIVDEKIYFIDAETAEGCGVPLDRFSEVVGTTEKHGIVMTADEIALHTFSKNVSSDVKKCEELIFRIFE